MTSYKIELFCCHKMSIAKPYDDPKWERLRTVRLLGSGMMGSVYLTELPDDTQKYIVKIGKFFPADLKCGTKNFEGGTIWRTLLFYTTMAKKNKKIFRTWTIDYKIIDNCNDFKINRTKFKHPGDHGFWWSQMNEKGKRFHLKLAKSKYCLFSIQPFIANNGSLGDLLHNLHLQLRSEDNNPPPITIKPRMPFTKRAFYGWIATLMTQMYAMRKLNCTHGDVHPWNTLIIPGGCTFIDYSPIYHGYGKNWKSRCDDDIKALLNFMFITNHYDEHCRLNKIYGDKKYPIGYKEGQKDIKRFRSTNKYREIAAMIPGVPKSVLDPIVFMLAEMMFPNIVKLVTIPMFATEAVWHEIWLIEQDDVILFLNNAFSERGLDLVAKKFSKY